MMPTNPIKNNTFNNNFSNIQIGRKNKDTIFNSKYNPTIKIIKNL